MAYIEFKNVEKIYKMGEVDLKALDKASFEIEKGELVVILGQSGSGKSTCLNILGGMDEVTSGNVKFTKVSKPNNRFQSRTEGIFNFTFYDKVHDEEYVCSGKFMLEV